MTDQPTQPDPKDQDQPQATPSPEHSEQESKPLDVEKVREQVISALQQVYDPEIPVSIWELGLIYKVDVSESGQVHIDMTLTTPNCPEAQSLPARVHNEVRWVPGVKVVDVDIVWEPAWGPERMSEAAKLQLGFL